MILVERSKAGVRQGKTNAEAINDDDPIAMDLGKGKSRWMRGPSVSLSSMRKKYSEPLLSKTGKSVVGQV
jgi:hypothetical protein